MVFWRAVLWLHVISMAFFVGGQLMLGAVVVPALRGLSDREPLRAAARGFGIGTLVAILVLIVTGSMMASHLHVWSNSTLHIKLALVVFVLVLIGVHMRKPEWHVVDGLILLSSFAIVWCGLVLAG